VTRQPNHRHVCRCGTELRCTQPPDQCAVLDTHDWECPACLMQRFDDYLSQLVTTQHDSTQQELTHEKF
jgi:hypothetical protein